jgi:hypothetical protein
MAVEQPILNYIVEQHKKIYNKKRYIKNGFRWSVIRWLTKNLLSVAPPCFGRHVLPLDVAAFAVVSTHQPALGLRGVLWPILLMCNIKGRPMPQHWGH